MRLVPISLFGAFTIATVACNDRPPVEANAAELPVKVTAMEIPKSIQAEHEEIHSALVQATQATGAVGAAAKALADVLDPHFVREEQIALPPLGLLAPLAAGAAVDQSVLAQATAMSDSLKRELPGMLAEHVRIRAAVGELRSAAQAAGATKYEQFAEKLALHSQAEEEVNYPAAILVGEIIRARMPGK